MEKIKKSVKNQYNHNLFLDTDNTLVISTRDRG